MENVCADTIGSNWLCKFDTAVSTGNVEATTALFLEEGWLRDILLFSWTHRSLCGHDAISTYLSECDNLKRAELRTVKLDRDHGIPPALIKDPGRPALVEAAFTFDSPIFHGRGLVRLVEDHCHEWKALTCFVTIGDLKGHEEQGPESGIYEERTKTWNTICEERRANIEKDPHVIIVGAGQTGLNVGARFRQMNIPALLIERAGAIGDVWRQRYPSLTLHTPNGHSSMLYHPYPRTWPKFTPKDKLASWLEQYAEDQELVVWTNSSVAPTPSYDPSTKRWTVNIIRDGKPVTLHPYHIVAAMGTLSRPWVPNISNQPEFQGEIFHAAKYKGGKPYAGKKAVIIGAGNSSADICQDLVSSGAASVTMVQRSRTTVIKKELVAGYMEKVWKYQEDSSIGDFRNASMPLGLMRKWSIERKTARVEDQKEMIEGLRKAGLNVDEGPDGAGYLLLLYGRLGGYWYDVGAADMIIDGRIKIKQGTEPTSFTPEGLLFKDGSTIDADLVVFATGWESILEPVREIFGKEVMQKTRPVWGVDEEFELRKNYTPSGYPGFWYALGGFDDSRFYSKSLALQIKAREIGLIKD